MLPASSCDRFGSTSGSVLLALCFTVLASCAEGLFNVFRDRFNSSQGSQDRL